MRPADRDMTRHTAPLSSQRRSTRTAETVELGRASGPSVGRTLVIIDLLVRHHILAVDRADAVCASRNGEGDWRATESTRCCEPCGPRFLKDKKLDARG